MQRQLSSFNRAFQVVPAIERRLLPWSAAPERLRYFSAKRAEVAKSAANEQLREHFDCDITGQLHISFPRSS
ncbi:MAG TPA: hypothetical protein VER12_10620 [Polyangiaceae bacterium]|nr:hypothetical protein [Polyangiaceae bacterium]